MGPEFVWGEEKEGEAITAKPALSQQSCFWIVSSVLFRGLNTVTKETGETEGKRGRPRKTQAIHVCVYGWEKERETTGVCLCVYMYVCVKAADVQLRSYYFQGYGSSPLSLPYSLSYYSTDRGQLYHFTFDIPFMSHHFFFFLKEIQVLLNNAHTQAAHHCLYKPTQRNLTLYQANY